jgi:hypothetical protein
MQLLRPPIRPHFLTMNAAGKRAGQPGHPLCLAKDLKPTPWDFFTDPRGNGYGA